MKSATGKEAEQFIKEAQNENSEFLQARSQLQKAEQFRNSGQIEKAIVICEQLVRKHPTYMGALYTLGMLAIDQKNYDRALVCLVRASTLNPLHWQSLVALSNVYLKLDSPQMAIQVLESARKINPADWSIYAPLGEVYYKTYEYEKAIKALKSSVNLNPNVWQAHLRHGQCLAHLGEYERAAEAFSISARLQPRALLPLYWWSSLPASFILQDLDQIAEKVGASPGAGSGDLDATALFARGNLLDKAGDHAEAWKCFTEGNRLKALSERTNLKKYEQIWNATLAHVRENSFKTKSETIGTGRNALSLFVLGPSRSGKTTTERLVAGLGDVKLGFENPIAHNALRHAFQSGGFLSSNFFLALPTELDQEFRTHYLDELDARAESASIFTNTHPSLIASVSRIASIVPNTKFVFVKRNPEDLALRIFMKLYGDEIPYAYDLVSIRKYISWYHELIDALHEKLPDNSIVLQYEDVISDPAAALERIARLCGVDFQVNPLPILGDDRGCAEPYRKFMEQ